MVRTLLIAVLALAVLVPAKPAAAQAHHVPMLVAVVRAYTGIQDPTNPDPGAIRRFALVAYGEGTTECTVGVAKYRLYDNTNFAGWTDCAVAVQQTGQISWAGGAGPLCSGFVRSCKSDGSAPGRYPDVHYRVTLVAPRGQGWIAPPAECSGAGTDRLDCTF